jgi:hypothetical protein
MGIILTAGVLTGCGASSVLDPTPTETVLSSTSEIAQPQVTHTPTSSPATIAVYINPDTESDKLAGLALPIIDELAASTGLQIEELVDLSNPISNPGTQIIVLIGVPTTASDLIQNHPEIQFLIIGETDIKPGANVSTIGSEGLPRHEQSFLAGYIAALITPEWRVGMMMTETEPNELADTFQRGVKFYCGLCRQTYPPFYDYPVFEIVEAGGVNQAFQALSGFSVNTVYASEGALTHTGGIEEGETLAIRIIGAAPPLDIRGSNWVTTIQFDLETPIKSVWSDLLEGNGGKELPIGFILTDVNDVLLSQGKFDHTNQVIGDVVRGYIGVEEIP